MNSTKIPDYTGAPKAIIVGVAAQILLAGWAWPESARAAGRPEPDAVSPALKIGPVVDRSKKDYPFSEPSPVRSLDGSGNNLLDPAMGAAYTNLRRVLPSDYNDAIAALGGADRPGPREISNAVCAQDAPKYNPRGATSMFWQWGQFLDHDIDLSDGVDPAEREDITVPVGDPYFDPDGKGKATIPFNRSNYDKLTGTQAGNPRQQINEISTWIDASNVYGSNNERAAALRTNDGTGQLKTSSGTLVPLNTFRLPNAGGPGRSLFLAGDVRANEQVGLTALHTLFVREHNRLAARISTDYPDLNGDEIYQKARRVVGAQMQVITYNEFLPLLLGASALKQYKGYDPNLDARIANVFSAAAYRFGHSALTSRLLRLDADGNEIDEGHLALRDAFFDPARITDEGGIDPVLRGLSVQVSQAIDLLVINDVRNFLFGDPERGGFDLASLNIQRGRDHGLPSYNDARAALGLTRVGQFVDISSDPEIQSRLQAVYNSVDAVDVWVGGLAEDPLPKAQVGELFFTIIKNQFEALRDGDRFWYALTLTDDEIREVEDTLLSDIIRRNTEIDDEIPDNVFGGSPPWHSESSSKK